MAFSFLKQEGMKIGNSLYDNYSPKIVRIYFFTIFLNSLTRNVFKKYLIKSSFVM